MPFKKSGHTFEIYRMLIVIRVSVTASVFPRQDVVDNCLNKKYAIKSFFILLIKTLYEERNRSLIRPSESLMVSNKL